jgi:predicted DNA-binding ribbon-helix-helix protein
LKRSIAIAGHRTSVSLEDEFWDALGEIAAERKMSVAALIGEIDKDRGALNLSAAIRIRVLGWYRGKAEAKAG